MSMDQTIETLLQQYIQSAPQRNASIIALLQDTGIPENVILKELEIIVHDPLPIMPIPTFEDAIFHEITPMLSDRFQFAGTIEDGDEIWVSLQKMAKVMSQPGIRRSFQNIRNHWENSIISQYDQSKLSLFSYER